MNLDLTTFVFEAVNFIVLVWLMQKLVYRPLRDGLEKRRGALESREAEALEAMDEAKLLQAASNDDRDELSRLRDDILREANEEAAEQRARILSQAREDAEAERARVKRLLESEREAALSWVSQLAVQRGTEVVGILLMQLAPDAIEEALFEQLRTEIERRDLADADLGEDQEVEVSAAEMLGGPRLAQLRKSLEKALGCEPRLAVREDDALRAGLVLRVGHLVLDASVAGQLDAFRERVRDELEAEVRIA